MEIQKKILFEWNNINFTIRKEKEHKILQNLSGNIQSGELLAILGPSGSGKTSFLNVLSNKVKREKHITLSGKITLNHKLQSEINFKNISAFVQQDDILYPQMTVFESLLMTSRMRLSSDISINNKKQMVDNLVRKLGLCDVKDSKIGNVLKRGISGGEKKRTCIGLELLTKPLIIFLDEPTSGLDSYQAKNIMQILKDLANNGHIVICSIHQPSSNIYKMFDKILFLSQGQTVYFGNGREKCINYFYNLGFGCPAHYNPSDYILDLISLDYSSEELLKSTKQQINTLIESHSCRDHLSLDDISLDDDDDDDNIENFTKLNDQTHFNSTWMEQFKLLFDRSLKEELRDKTTITIRLSTNLFFSIILSMIFSGINDGQKSIQDTFGLLFFICINQAFSCLFPTLKKFAVEKEIVFKERENKSYHCSAFYLAKFLSSYPLEVFIVIIYSSVVYWAVGLNSDLMAFGTFLIIISNLVLSAMGMGMLISSLAKNMNVALAIASPFMIVILLFGGFYSNLSNMPIWISWLQYFSFISWGFQGLIINEYTDKTLECFDIKETEPCLTTGKQVLSRYSFDVYTKTECIIFLVLIGIFFHILSYLVLRFKKPKYQHIEIIDDNPQTDIELV
jgi:ABC-type multidrug transport system ATPase subunit/ABC-type multidrug transport system permease subunit